MSLDVPFTCRPIEKWPGELTTGRRWSPFRAGWTQTMNLLDRELHRLDASNVVLQLAITEQDIRLDGRPRSGAKADHPGIILAFDSKFGPLQYATDVFTHWEDNLRAIALALEALRKVDRYGVSKRGEQYTGWKALPSGSGPNVERGKGIISEFDGDVRAALRATHPDQGGDGHDFGDVDAARKALASGR